MLSLLWDIVNASECEYDGGMDGHRHFTRSLNFTESILENRQVAAVPIDPNSIHVHL